ncbi:unnamed protein product [Calypogeia fissa]
MGSAGELPPDRFTNVRKSGSYRRMTSDHVHIDVGDGGGELSRNRSYRSGSRGFTAPTDWMANVGSGENLMAVDNVFSRQSSVSSAQGDEEALHWAALEKLPTFDRLRTAVLRYVGDDGMKRTEEIDVTKMSIDDRQHIIERILRITEEDNERFLAKLRGRLDRVGIELPAIEVRYEHLTVNAEVHQGSRATPSLPNFFKSLIEWPFQVLGATKKTKLNILQDVSGVLKPRRLTLLLGPPQSGRTTLLRALAGRLDTDLYVSGDITYNGHEMQEFVPRKTSAYISQFDLQSPELTVRESLDFYSRVQGVGNRYDMVSELERREREAGIKPEADIDIYLKATSVMGQSSNLVTDYVMRLMGLDICADTIMGDQMRRGISGGQKKRVTTAEMLVGPAKALFMDEISTGLDSSTTFQITKMLRQIVHLMDSTIVVALLQPPPETYALFDDVILLADGEIVYQGPCCSVLEFMAYMGFRCPERKATADFLQEVTSRKDQRQYWADKAGPYEYITVAKFVEGFKNFHVGQNIEKELSIPYDKTQSHPAALVYDKYSLSNRELLKACFQREVILMKRHRATYVAKVIQIAIVAFVAATLYLRTTLHHDTINEANVYMGALFFCLLFVMTAGLAELAFTLARLPVYFKEKELFLYPAWCMTLPMFLLRIPWTILEAGVYLIIVYFVTGFSPEPGRFFRLFLVLILINQTIVGLFRFAASVARTRVYAMLVGSTFNITTVLLGGFVLSRDNIPVWWKWASWTSALMYGQQAVSVNEFLSKEWDKPFGNTTVGIAALQHRGLETRGYWVWLSTGALVGYVILYNILLTLSLQYLAPPPVQRSTAVKPNDDSLHERDSLQRDSISQRISARLSGFSNYGDKTAKPTSEGRVSMQSVGTPRSSGFDDDGFPQGPKGMVLPFLPLSITFDKINYYVDMPETMKEQGIRDKRLQLLSNVSGAFRPGVLTALVGVSGAGKTTLMDVLAGRKTRGYIEGEILISGYPKQQATFARIAGYCEQNDIHSPNITVFESLVYSAWMRLSPDVDKRTRMMFVEEVMSLVELDVLRDNVVGLPGESGLSTEQRKRLTIAVELVANPSIIFMDEPTSGLDARAAAIVMRAVRNIGDTGRTVVCTIHQPSIDIFEAFDELLLLKRGGETIYAGPLGRRSKHLIKYFEAIPGVPKIKEGYNPATWMLEISSISMEARLGVNFEDVYAKSAAYQANDAIIQQLSVPCPSSKDLEFPTVYAQSFGIQCLACLWKMGMSYWRNTTYTGVKLLFTTGIGLLIGSVFWGLGKKRGTEQDVLNLMGGLYCSVLFVGATNALTVQPVVGIERIVYYRERGAGMYSPLAYAIAQFVIEWPYIFVQSLLFTGVAYSMIQFEWQHEKVLWFFFFLYFTLLFYTYWGMISVAATPNAAVASILATSLFGFFNLFSGFTITKNQMPVWWKWFYWCTPTSWTLYGLIASQLGDVETDINVPDQPGAQISVKDFIDSYFGFKHSFLKFVAIEQVLLLVAMAFIFASCIKNFNFQRR